MFIQSDNGGAFIARITQEVSRVLNLCWKVHASWRPQSTCKLEKRNHTLKKTVTKICQINLTWDKASPVALLWVKVDPTSRLQLSQLWNVVWETLPSFQKWFEIQKELKLRNIDNVRCVESLEATLTALGKFASSRLMFPADVHLCQFCPGDWVLLKSWKNKHPEGYLHPCWTGPYEVLLMTHSLVKVKGLSQGSITLKLSWSHRDQCSHHILPTGMFWHYILTNGMRAEEMYATSSLCL